MGDGNTARLRLQRVPISLLLAVKDMEVTVGRVLQPYRLIPHIDANLRHALQRIALGFVHPFLSGGKAVIIEAAQGEACAGDQHARGAEAGGHE